MHYKHREPFFTLYQSNPLHRAYYVYRTSSFHGFRMKSTQSYKKNKKIKNEIYTLDHKSHILLLDIVILKRHAGV